jgi:hypothetical protein
MRNVLVIAVFGFFCNFLLKKVQWLRFLVVPFLVWLILGHFWDGSPKNGLFLPHFVDKSLNKLTQRNKSCRPSLSGLKLVRISKLNKRWSRFLTKRLTSAGAKFASMRACRVGVFPSLFEFGVIMAGSEPSLTISIFGTRLVTID